MNQFKPAFAILCLGVVAASAHSQEFASSSVSNHFSVYGFGVYVTSVSGQYYDIASTYAFGVSSEYSHAYGVYDTHAYALNEAWAGPGYGLAQTGHGFEYFITVTNSNVYGVGSYFTAYSVFHATVSTTAHGYVTAGGGLQEFGGSNLFGYDTINMDAGVFADTSENWTNITTTYSPGYAYVSSYGIFSDYLAWGQSVTIGFFSAGIANAHSTSSGAPSPVAVAPFAIGLIGVLRRRKKN